MKSKYCRVCDVAYPFTSGMCPNCRSIYWSSKKEEVVMSKVTGKEILERGRSMELKMIQIVDSLRNLRGIKGQEHEAVVKDARKDERFPVQLLVEEYDKIVERYQQLCRNMYIEEEYEEWDD